MGGSVWDGRGEREERGQSFESIHWEEEGWEEMLRWFSD